MKKIDIFPHIFPQSYLRPMMRSREHPGPGGDQALDCNIPVLYDLDARIEMMEQFGPDYQQILTLSMPAIEYLAPRDEIARARAPRQ